MISEERVSFPATYVNYRTVVCTLPSVHSFPLTISNNGIYFSQSYNILVLDSQCVERKMNGDIVFEVSLSMQQIHGFAFWTDYVDRMSMLLDESYDQLCTEELVWP